MRLTKVEEAFVTILLDIGLEQEEIAVLLTMLDTVERMTKMVDYIEEIIEENETPKFNQLLEKAAQIISE